MAGLDAILWRSLAVGLIALARAWLRMALRLRKAGLIGQAGSWPRSGAPRI